MKDLKLITALGNKDLVLELIDFFNGGDSYCYNSAASAIRRKFTAGWRLTDVHLIRTQDAAITEALAALRRQVDIEYPGLAIHDISLPCSDIACAGDDATMRELVYHAVQSLAAEDLIIASGGRKTLTNRLIEAGLLYGCMGYLSLTAPPGHEKRENTAHFNILSIQARDFVRERRQGLIKDEEDTLGDNFRSLYLLPLTMIERLRHERIGSDPAHKETDLAWLQRLPKADLHCHMGGAYDTALLKAMAVALLDEVKVDETGHQAILRKLTDTLGKPLATITAHDLRQLRPEESGKKVHALSSLDIVLAGVAKGERHIWTAVLVNALSEAQLDDLSRDGCSGHDWPKDLDWYMACGNLGGSSLLQTEGALRLNLRWLLEQSWQENATFLEVRFSPGNYTRGGLAIPQVITILLDEARQFMAKHPGFRVNFLIMATRHKERAATESHIAAAVTFGQLGSGPGPRITGFDLAGQEEGNDPALFQDIFMPLHHHFINITIHAGEMADDDKIWEAIYLLHARRIGHGLKLINNTKMMGYIRDHAIAIEMCPSSNTQTNHFRRFDQDGKTTGEIYPLHEYLRHGIAVTINTDNRGISDTTLSKEYLQAARLTEGGLSRWEILRLVKNGFKAAFLPKDEKDRLLKEVDAKVFELVLNDFFPEQEL